MRNLDTLQETENQNVVTKSIIFAPFNSKQKKWENGLLADDLKVENEVVRMCGKVKEANRNYELNNNGEIDNGFLITTENQNSQLNYNTSSSNVMNNNSKVDSKMNSGTSSKASLNSQNNDAYNNIKLGSNKNSNTNSNANLNFRMNNTLEDDILNNKLTRKSTNSREYLMSYNALVISRIIFMPLLKNFIYLQVLVLLFAVKIFLVSILIF